MYMKLNRKGYLIVEIIVASVLAMGIAFFLVRLTISFSRKDEDIYKSITFTNNKNIITNKIMEDINNYTLTKVEEDNNVVTFTYWDEHNLKNYTRELTINKTTKDITYDNYKKNIGNALEIGDMAFTSNSKYTSIVIPITNIYNDEDYSIKLFIPYAIEFTSDNMVFDYSERGNIGFRNNVTTDTDGAFFSGNNSYVNCGLNNYDFNDKITIMIKVKFNDLNSDGQQHIIGNWEGAGGGLVKTANNTIFYELYVDGGYKQTESTIKVTANTWYSIVGVYDKGKMKLYINDYSAEADFTGKVKKSSTPIVVGGNPDDDGSVNGLSKITVKDVLVYNDALSEENVKKYINNEDSDKYELPSTNLLFYYKFK